MVKTKFRISTKLIVAFAGFVIAMLTLIIPTPKIVSPLSPLHSLTDKQVKNSTHEVFGFLPHWTMDGAANIDFDTLTTLAYFDVKVAESGDLITNDPGYESFNSRRATEIFREAHESGTRVVVTISMMNNASLKALMDDPIAQQRTIDQTVALVKARGIDGTNIDFEYDGNPGQEYRNKFTLFASNMTQKMHSEIPASRVTASAYASGVKYAKLQDIGDVAEVTDGIFIMGYDFAITSSEVAMPTAPLNGYKEGKYWYDISTAVEDFLSVAPSNKLILGTPWYGLDFPVYQPGFKAERNYWGRAIIHTYGAASQQITPDMADIAEFKTGWDEMGQMSWKAYKVASTGEWRMVYVDDVRSLQAKYQFAKDKELLGVGMWAIGYESNSKELWTLLGDMFGNKVADVRILNKPIHENI